MSRGWGHPEPPCSWAKTQTWFSLLRTSPSHPGGVGPPRGSQEGSWKGAGQAKGGGHAWLVQAVRVGWRSGGQGQTGRLVCVFSVSKGEGRAGAGGQPPAQQKTSLDLAVPLDVPCPEASIGRKNQCLTLWLLQGHWPPRQHVD